MKKSMRRILVAFAASVLLIIMSSAGNASSVAEGTKLYNENCAGCHGALPTSAYLGATPPMIMAGIANVPGMSGYETLTADELISISLALDSSQQPAPAEMPKPRPAFRPKPADGAELYAENCARCHGGLSESKVTNTSSANIDWAIRTNRGGMRSIKLTKAQLAYIATALSDRASTAASGGVPADIGDTYTSQQCAQCHYPDGKVRPGSATMQTGSNGASMH